jgi:hypothetical protein
MAMAYKEDPHKLGAPKGSMNSKGTGRGHGKSTGNINANSRNGGTKEAVKRAKATRRGSPRPPGAAPGDSTIAPPIVAGR